MKTLLSLFVVMMVFAGCGDSGSVAEFLFKASDNTETSTALKEDDACQEGEDEFDVIFCATPVEYRLNLIAIEGVSCGEGLVDVCEKEADGSKFVNQKTKMRFNSVSGGATTGPRSIPVIEGYTLRTFGVIEGSEVGRNIGGLRLLLAYIEVDLPEEDDAIQDIEIGDGEKINFRGATLRLCLIDECVENALRGDVLVKLEGSDNFQWQELGGGVLDTRLEDAVVTVPAIVNEDPKLGIFSKESLGIPLLMEETLTVGAFMRKGEVEDFTIKVDVSNTLHCLDSEENGACSAWYWPALPKSFETVLP